MLPQIQSYFCFYGSLMKKGFTVVDGTIVDFQLRLSRDSLAFVEQKHCQRQLRLQHYSFKRLENRFVLLRALKICHCPFYHPSYGLQCICISKAQLLF